MDRHFCDILKLYVERHQFQHLKTKFIPQVRVNPTTLGSIFNVSFGMTFNSKISSNDLDLFYSSAGFRFRFTSGYLK